MRKVVFNLPCNEKTCGKCIFCEDSQDVEASRWCRSFDQDLGSDLGSRTPRCKKCLDSEVKESK